MDSEVTIVEPGQCHLASPVALTPCVPYPSFPTSFCVPFCSCSHFLPPSLLCSPSCPQPWVKPRPSGVSPLPCPLLPATGGWLNRRCCGHMQSAPCVAAVAVLPIGAAGQLLLCSQQWLECGPHFSRRDRTAADTVYWRHVPNVVSSGVQVGLFPSRTDPS